MGQAKTKRARTSFKHHQLRIMKAHFQVNQNPDSRELKMLSQKTGLDKKVLQVKRIFVGFIKCKFMARWLLKVAIHGSQSCLES